MRTPGRWPTASSSPRASAENHPCQEFRDAVLAAPQAAHRHELSGVLDEVEDAQRRRVAADLVDDGGHVVSTVLLHQLHILLVHVRSVLDGVDSGLRGPEDALGSVSVSGDFAAELVSQKVLEKLQHGRVIELRVRDVAAPRVR